MIHLRLPSFHVPDPQVGATPFSYSWDFIVTEASCPGRALFSGKALVFVLAPFILYPPTHTLVESVGASTCYQDKGNNYCCHQTQWNIKVQDQDQPKVGPSARGQQLPLSRAALKFEWRTM